MRKSYTKVLTISLILILNSMKQDSRKTIFSTNHISYICFKYQNNIFFLKKNNVFYVITWKGKRALAQKGCKIHFLL